MRVPILLGQLHIKLAVHRAEFGLWCQVSVLVKAGVAGDMPWELLRAFNNTRDRCVDFVSHFIQEVGHLGRKSVLIIV